MEETVTGNATKNDAGLLKHLSRTYEVRISLKGSLGELRMDDRMMTKTLLWLLGYASKI
jgi:hypothetical protein